MSQFVVDATLSAQLANVKQTVDVVDANGRRLGRFVPEEPEPLCPWDPNLTREEIDRRMKEPGRTWAEIRQRLEAMRPS